MQKLLGLYEKCIIDIIYIQVNGEKQQKKRMTKKKIRNNNDEGVLLIIGNAAIRTRRAN
jgi:hypothetical protein